MKPIKKKLLSKQISQITYWYIYNFKLKVVQNLNINICFKKLWQSIRIDTRYKLYLKMHTK